MSLLNVIKTERLKLTPLNINDVERFVEIAKNMRLEKEKNPEYFLYTRFDDDAVKTEDDLKNAVITLLRSVDNTDFSVISKRLNICLSDGYIIGYIGFIHNSEDESSDFGIFLDPKYEHKGYAFEAQIGLLGYYFLNFADKINLTIHPKNLPSYKLNTKCGAVKISHVENSKYGSERDILVITRQMFLKTVFQKEFSTIEEEQQFLFSYLGLYNEI